MDVFLEIVLFALVPTLSQLGDLQIELGLAVDLPQISEIGSELDQSLWIIQLLARSTQAWPPASYQMIGFPIYKISTISTISTCI